MKVQPMSEWEKAWCYHTQLYEELLKRGKGKESKEEFCLPTAADWLLHGCGSLYRSEFPLEEKWLKNAGFQMLCYHQGTLHFQTLYSSLLSKFVGHVWLMCARAVLCSELQLLCNTAIRCLVLNVLFQAAWKKGQGYALKTIWTLLSL